MRFLLSLNINLWSFGFIVFLLQLPEKPYCIPFLLIGYTRPQLAVSGRLAQLVRAWC